MAALVPIAWDIQERREARAQLVALREASRKLIKETAAFDITGRKLAEMSAHRRAVVALIERRRPVAHRMLDIMRACADGVRLTLVRSVDDHLQVEGYATTQSRVRETQKRLRALPWVKKVAEVESSVVPESVRRQWIGAQTPVSVPNIRRFTLRIERKPSPTPTVLAVDADVDVSQTQEVPDAR
ncbi:PilN domain-containing protein [Pandoraea sp. NPDC087047]|uniref:PilN domain-containing protein n=1 Tax=Pandoraea sp. NPDC087047 TaxID=3364390 RepID=UPI0037FC0F37